MDIKRAVETNDSERKALLTQPDIDGFVVTEANMSYNFIASVVGQSVNLDSDKKSKQKKNDSGKKQDEDILLVDAENCVLGTEKRSVVKANPKSMWHRNSVVFISTPKGFLVQHLANTKDYCPGFFDLATGGIQNTDDDLNEALRELRE